MFPDAVTYSEHARRKTVTGTDVMYSLKRQDRTVRFWGLRGDLVLSLVLSAKVSLSRKAQ